jgi:hypothetical protein
MTFFATAFRGAVFLVRRTTAFALAGRLATLRRAVLAAAFFAAVVFAVFFAGFLPADAVFLPADRPTLRRIATAVRRAAFRLAMACSFPSGNLGSGPSLP